MSIQIPISIPLHVEALEVQLQGYPSCHCYNLHCAIDRVDAATHIPTFRTQEERDDISAFLRCSLPPKGGRIIEWCVRGTVRQLPALLHQRSKNGSRCYGIDPHLSMAILLGRRLGQAYDTMLASIICAVFRKAYAVRRSAFLHRYYAR